MLRQILKELINKDKKITFARYMELVLYHPQYGYYMKGPVRSGKHGDYYTSPIVHKIFGELLCEQLIEMWEIMGKGEFIVVEMGAGEGSLSRDIIRYACRKYPRFYENLQYIIIERSGYARKIQQENFEKEDISREKVIWTDYEDPVFSRTIKGCFISNELVDSFPVHVVENHEGILQEVYVTLQDGDFIEVLDELSTSEIEDYFKRININLQEGQRGEVNLEAIDWMKWIGRSLNEGFVITIDYGYPADELYAPYRMEGTLLCYYRHTMNKNPYIHVGEQDITSHVDFTTLMNAGKDAGLTPLGLTDQMHFLMNLGFLEKIEETLSKSFSEGLHERLLAKNLVMPGAMGEVFRVLIQYKGDRKIISLKGLHNIFT